MANALDPSAYAADYTGIVCTEVLEHIERDLDAIRLWKPGAWCVCSVPNFDYRGHVRFFRREEDIRARYGDLIDISSLTRIAKPAFRGTTPSAYVRRLRWARDDPRKFLGILGINRFNWDAGWFLFAGRRR